DKGEFVIETEDENVEVAVNRQGVKITDIKTGREYRLKVGKHAVRTGEYVIEPQLLTEDIEIEGGKTFTVKRGGKGVVTAKFRDKGDHLLAGKTDRELIQGTWKLAHIEEKGVALPDDLVKKSVLSASVTDNDISLTEDPKSPLARLEFKGRFH